MDTVDLFQKIHRKYDELFKKDLTKGKLPMRSTEYGFWGTASTIAIYDFFTKIKLENYDHFVDLGSGDGRVVLIASLFTKATGIEGDETLLRQAEEIRDELNLKANFHCENFLSHDLSKYDICFIYPDKGFTDEFENKLKKEMRGSLFVYNQIYTPNKLEKGQTYLADQLPIISFTKP